MAWSKVEGVLVVSPGKGEETLNADYWRNCCCSSCYNHCGGSVHYTQKNMDDQGQRKVPGKKFHVSLAGCTNGAHETYVNNLKGLGQIKVISLEQSDYLVLFCPIASRVGTDIGEAMDKMTVPGKKFHVSLAGCTNGAHQTYVNGLKGLGQIEVISPEQSDYLVLFCPIASRVGTDIGEAMDKIPDHFVPESRRLVENPDVIVTVDVLFHESKMLICKRNDMAWSKVKGVLVVSPGKKNRWKNNKPALMWRKYSMLIIVLIVVVIVVITIVVVVHYTQK
ncbi:hypothetical protein F7725_019949 [Dissostichus mawsoni]|uniref:Uncharacterized protein n=1 Tax=Dissostichus mawsoni TaxID=36200 RepID=A0A7J5YLI9_DISMA|nr:hypothetical protein F7725_019949 [Dissostichus mawsoni]